MKSHLQVTSALAIFASVGAYEYDASLMRSHKGRASHPLLEPRLPTEPTAFSQSTWSGPRHTMGWPMPSIGRGGDTATDAPTSKAVASGSVSRTVQRFSTPDFD